MFKLLSKQDRRAVKNEEVGDLKVLTTAGIGLYQCVNCLHYNSASPEAPSGLACVTRNVPPDAMPCTFSPRRPEAFFVLRQGVPGKEKIETLLTQLDLQSMLVLYCRLPKAIEQLVEKEALGLPYRVGDYVSLIHNQFLVDARVTGFDSKVVHLSFRADPLAMTEEQLQVPHAQVIPKKRKVDGFSEITKDSSTSEPDLKQTPPLPEP